MKKDDDIINESSIDDLIKYSEAESEEDDFNSDMAEAAPAETADSSAINRVTLAP